jgi:VanZ family protein
MHAVRFIPMMSVMGIIFFLSSQPGNTLNLPDIPDLDKVLHAVAYGGLALTVLFAVADSYRSNPPYRISLLVVLFCLTYGISDEFHQSFVPYRTPSIFDLAADTVGALAAVFLWHVLLQKKGRRV